MVCSSDPLLIAVSVSVELLGLIAVSVSVELIGLPVVSVSVELIGLPVVFIDHPNELSTISVEVITLLVFEELAKAAVLISDGSLILVKSMISGIASSICLGTF